MSDLNPGGSTAAHTTHAPPTLQGARRLRLLSFNIQTGITTNHYRQYLTQSWRHVLPFAQRSGNLDTIANLVSDYDLVGLQEVDAGSIRSSHINQTEYLAAHGEFPYWYDQTNRSLGRFAQHSIGLLSRLQPSYIREHKLPGRIPGRGVLRVRYGDSVHGLTVLIVHLALSRRARLHQLGFISELVNSERHVILMGDLNCRSHSPEMDFLINTTLMREPTHGLNTFPSWRPQRNIDHILVTPTLQVESAQVLNVPLSDHLPIAMNITLPESLRL